MQPIDWLIVIGYLILTMGLGLYLSNQALRRPMQSLVDFFVAGRSLTWWLAGTSMAATTFSVDTPLYVAGIVGNRGIAGNWEWWSFGFAHVVMVYVFARLWRRSAVVTDAELTELRYGGEAASVLRGVKAFLFAVPLNCLGIGYAMLAMAKVLDVLQLWPTIGLDSATDNSKLWSVVAMAVLVLFYAGFSSLWHVVATDFFQYFLALFGSFIVAIASLSAVDGIRPLVNYFSTTDASIDMLGFFPSFNDGLGGMSKNFGAIAGLPAGTFLAYVMLQWWSFRRSDGGGEFVQRIVSVQSETDAEKATWLFNLLHYVVRTWPWIISALAAVILYPGLADKELGYPLLMVNYLPPIILGLVVASLVAAFLSTVSTLVNWGASYLASDVYSRFFSPSATPGELLLAGRVASLLIVILGGTAAFIANDVASLFRLAIAVGTGPGLIFILRWFWWRINAAAELTAVITGFFAGVLTSLSPMFAIEPFGQRLVAISLVTTLCWVTAMLLTAPESDATLDRFYGQIRPGGPGWKKQQTRTQLRPLQNLALDSQKVVAATLLLFSSLFAVGGFLLLRSLTGWLSLLIAVSNALWLRTLNKRPAFPMARPGTEDG
ncbi:MAG: sodium:solute symporter family protein [Cyanobacteria bacterium J06627_28]